MLNYKHICIFRPKPNSFEQKTLDFSRILWSNIKLNSLSDKFISRYMIAISFWVTMRNYLVFSVYAVDDSVHEFCLRTFSSYKMYWEKLYTTVYIRSAKDGTLYELTTVRTVNMLVAYQLSFF